MGDLAKLQQKLEALGAYSFNDFVNLFHTEPLPALSRMIAVKIYQAMEEGRCFRPRVAATAPIGTSTAPQEGSFCGGAAGGPPTEEERLKALQTAREGSYGDTALNMRCLGEAWTPLIERHYGIQLPHPIPPHVAAVILVHLKTVRMCGPGYHKDNYDDARNFLRFADENDERKPK